MLCAIWYLYKLKNVKNTDGGVILASACNFNKSNTLPWVFSRFLHCTNGTKSRKASHMIQKFPRSFKHFKRDKQFENFLLEITKTKLNSFERKETCIISGFVQPVSSMNF